MANPNDRYSNQEQDTEKKGGMINDPNLDQGQRQQQQDQSQPQNNRDERNRSSQQGEDRDRGNQQR